MSALRQIGGLSDAVTAPHLTKVDAFGHSGISPYGLADSFKGLAQRFANMLGADVADHGIEVAYLTRHESVPGTLGNGGWGRFYDRMTINTGPQTDTSFMPQRDFGLFFWGAVDWQQIGNSTAVDGGLTVYKNALRTVLARYRCAKLYEDDDNKSITGTTANASNQVTALGGTALTSADNGKPVTGTNIPANTYILSGAGTATLTLSANATGTNTGLTVGTIVYGNNWSSLANATDGSRTSSGTTARYSTASGSTITIRVPSYYKGYNALTGGGAIDIFTFATSAQSANWAVSVDGGGAVNYDFRGAFSRDYPSTSASPTNPFNSPAVIRLTGLAAGAHTITITETHSTAQGGWFDGWGIEADTPPWTCCLKMTNAAVGWAAAVPYPLSDSLVANTFNPATQAVVDEFGPYAFTVDLTYLASQVGLNFSLPDGHQNEEGHAAFAREIYRAFIRRFQSGMENPSHAAKSSDFPYISRTPNDKDRNVIQSADFSQTGLIVRGQTGQDSGQTVVNLTRANLQEWQTATQNRKFAIQPDANPIWQGQSSDPVSPFLNSGMVWLNSGDGNFYAYSGTSKKAVTADVNTWHAAEYIGATSAAAQAAANGWQVVMLVIPHRQTIAGLQWECVAAGTTPSAQLALFDNSGNRVAVTGSFTPASGIRKDTWSGGSYDAKPGRYFAMLWCSVTSTTFTCARAHGPSSASTNAGGTPTTVTVPTTSVATVRPCLMTF